MLLKALVITKPLTLLTSCPSTKTITVGIDSMLNRLHEEANKIYIYG